MWVFGTFLGLICFWGCWAGVVERRCCGRVFFRLVERERHTHTHIHITYIRTNTHTHINTTQNPIPHALTLVAGDRAVHGVDVLELVRHRDGVPVHGRAGRGGEALDLWRWFGLVVGE